MAGSKRELAELLTEVGLFSRCTKRERQTIARHAQTAELPAGHRPHPRGRARRRAVRHPRRRGRRAARRRGGRPASGPGSYFGELAILDGAPRSATVVAATDVKVAVLGIRMFRTLLREFPDLAEQLLVGLAGELRAAQRRGAGGERTRERAS